MKMKNIYTLLICLLIGFSALGQGNLQFNQVLNYSGKFTATGESTTYTVPENKVWKIEYLTPSKIGTGPGMSPANGFLLPVINGVTPELSDPNPPIWLKAGSTLKYRYESPSAYSPEYLYRIQNWIISVIEYNIIP